MNSMRGAGGNLGGYKLGQMPNFTPEQMNLLKHSFSHVNPGSYLERLASGDQSLYEGMDQSALRNFQGLQGQIASRFSGSQPGQLSARRGSGFQNTMNQATSDFSMDLQDRRQKLQMEAIAQLMGLSESLLNQRPYENFLIKPKEKHSFLQQILQGGLPILGGILGSLFGSPGTGASSGSAVSAGTGALAGAHGRSAGIM